MSSNLPPPEAGLSTAARISNFVVQLMSSYTGRGPTTAWTSIDQDLITVVLRDPLTRGERSLVAEGHGPIVLDVCKAYQNTMGEELSAGVEQLSGRNVIAFLSDNHIEPNIAIEASSWSPCHNRTKGLA